VNPNTVIVVTSISAPNQPMLELAEGCIREGVPFFVIGDTKTPVEYSLPGAEFYSLRRQHETDFGLAKLCPEGHYARKNLGYLLAIRAGAEVIVETDDDNLPLAGFWEPRRRKQEASAIDGGGWINVYKYFTHSACWPRGLPLDMFHLKLPQLDSLKASLVDCPIQQGLANGDPDVDAIFRLLFSLPLEFWEGLQLAIGSGSWCPFNSQNTSWWPDVYPLMYLPAYCSIRTTDIWRSFVAQRIAWANKWSVLFHSPTVYQIRNEHDLMRDFRDEIPGYLNNRTIAESLERLALRAGVENLDDNLRLSYEELIRLGLIDKRELLLLDAWLTDIAAASSRNLH
jgi:hypothetical protein